MDDLKPCPFCGGKVTPWVTGFGVVSVVECKACRTRFLFPYHRKCTDLFEFWNRRVDWSDVDKRGEKT